MCASLSEGVQGRECSKKRERKRERGGWAALHGMLDSLHLPFAKLEPSNVRRHQGRRRKDRWTKQRDKERKEKHIAAGVEWRDIQ